MEWSLCWGWALRTCSFRLTAKQLPVDRRRRPHKRPLLSGVLPGSEFPHCEKGGLVFTSVCLNRKIVYSASVAYMHSNQLPSSSARALIFMLIFRVAAVRAFVTYKTTHSNSDIQNTEPSETKPKRKVSWLNVFLAALEVNPLVPLFWISSLHSRSLSLSFFLLVSFLLL